MTKEKRIAELKETIREAKMLGNTAEVRELEAVLRKLIASK